MNILGKRKIDFVNDSNKNPMAGIIKAKKNKTNVYDHVFIATEKICGCHYSQCKCIQTLTAWKHIDEQTNQTSPSEISQMPSLRCRKLSHFLASVSSTAGKRKVCRNPEEYGWWPTNKSSLTKCKQERLLLPPGAACGYRAE